MNHIATGLSSRELALLSEWEMDGVTRVRPCDLAERLGEPAVARKTLARLAAKRALDRVAKGVYAVRPLRAVGQPWAWSSAASVAHAMAGQTYYVGGAVALTLHRLTTQVNHAVVDVFVPAQRDDRSIDGVRVRFHTAAWKDAFAFGVTTVEVDGVPVAVSDPERTLLDVLDRPELVGGAAAAVDAFRTGIARVDAAHLAEHAARWGRISLRQRAGYLLEQAGVPPAILAPLAAATAPTNTVPLPKASRRPRGRAHPVWRVVDPGA
ncbi:MAG TPA: type IV toxin-antitoxin system AbiEi family antitoxin [Chloroflexota bacterium]|jgi:predicted transcriptional regulator of viral defense system